VDEKSVKLTHTQYVEGIKELFIKFLDEYIILQNYKGKESYRWYRDVRFISTNNADIVYLWDYDNNRKTLGFIKIIEIPKDRLKLTIHFDRRFYDESKHAWVLLRSALVESGFIKVEVHNPPSYLSEKQKKIEELFYKDVKNELIANRLGISVSTVKRLKRSMGLRKKKT
jgi:hypothetical protein